MYVRPCEPAELSFVIESIDREFVLNKGRRLSLSCRYPNVISQQNVKHIQVAVMDHSICGAVAIRMFDYLIGKSLWHGAMIGMVWVEPKYRGKDVGKELITTIGTYLKENHCDFGVLWTGQPLFYQKLGWFISDTSLYAEINGNRVSVKTEPVICRTLNSSDIVHLANIRINRELQRVVRAPLDYHVKPIPVDEVDCFFVTDNEGDGYALVGKADNCGFFYEMDAPPVLWDIIWRAITMQYEKLIINGQRGEPFSKWLTDMHQIKWQQQNKTMWLPLSQRAYDISLESFYIPYFDRI